MGRAWASTMTIVLRAGPGLGILFAGRAGPGPHNSVCRPVPGRVCTTAAGPGRAWASNHICGPGLGLNFRPVQGPSTYANRMSDSELSVVFCYTYDSNVPLLMLNAHLPTENRRSSVGVYQTQTRSSAFVGAIPPIQNLNRR